MGSEARVGPRVAGVRRLLSKVQRLPSPRTRPSLLFPAGAALGISLVSNLGSPSSFPGFCTRAGDTWLKDDVPNAKERPLPLLAG